MRSGRLYAVGEARHLSVKPAHPPVSVRCEHIFHKLDREFTSSDRHAFKFGLQKNDYKKYETGANSSIGARGDPLQVSNRNLKALSNSPTFPSLIPFTTTPFCALLHFSRPTTMADKAQPSSKIKYGGS